MIVAILKGFYPYFFPLAVYGIFLRLAEKRWTKAETILILLFLSHIALMLFQVLFCGGDFSRRYLLPGVPLIFGWAGYALHHLSSRKIFPRIVAGCLLFLLLDALRPALEHYWKKSKKEELFVISNLTPVIRRDWQGQAPFYTPEIRWNVYHSPKRPLVQCERYTLLGYASGGSGISQPNPLLPLPDYRIFENAHAAPPYVEIYQLVYSGKIYRIGKRIK